MKNKYIFWTLIIVVFLLFVLILLAFFFKNFHCFLATHFHLNNDPSKVFVFLGVAFSGSIILLQQLFFLRRVKANESIAISQQSGVFQERFNNAITLLQYTNTSVRLGAVYTLAHLGADEKGSYLTSVIEILCGHLRSLSQNPEYKKNYKDKPSIETQIILDILFKKGGKCLNKLANYTIYIDLTNTYLVGYQFVEYYLQKVNFSGSILSKSTFRDSKCQLTNFEGCEFYDSHFYNSNFTKSRFSLAVFASFRFENNSMMDCSFFSSILYNGGFFQTKLQGANIDYGHFLRVHFVDTYFSASIYSDPCFNHTFFDRCYFSPRVKSSEEDFISRLWEYVNISDKESLVEFILSKISSRLDPHPIDKIKPLLSKYENNAQVKNFESFKLTNKPSEFLSCTFSYSKDQAKLWEKEYKKSLEGLRC